MHSGNSFWDEVFVRSGLSASMPASMAISYISQNAHWQPPENQYNNLVLFWLAVTNDKVIMVTRGKKTRPTWATDLELNCIIVRVKAACVKVLSAYYMTEYEWQSFPLYRGSGRSSFSQVLKTDMHLLFRGLNQQSEKCSANVWTNR